MAAWDAFFAVFLFFSIIAAGWMMDFFFYVADHIAEDKGSNGVLVDVAEIKPMLKWISDLIYVSIIPMAAILSAYAFYSGFKSTLDPKVMGVYLLIALLVAYFTYYHAAPIISESLKEMQFDQAYFKDWMAKFKEFWYYIMVAGFLGNLFGYMRGASERVSLQ